MKKLADELKRGDVLVSLDKHPIVCHVYVEGDNVNVLFEDGRWASYEDGSEVEVKPKTVLAQYLRTGMVVRAGENTVKVSEVGRTNGGLILVSGRTTQTVSRQWWQCASPNCEYEVIQ